MLDEVVIEMSIVRKVIGALALGAAAVVMFGDVAAANDPGDTVVFLIDVSGSMEGEPLDQAKSALVRELASLPESRPVGLRAFAGECEDPPVLAIAPGEATPSSLTSMVERLGIGGGTPTGPALLAAAADLPAGSGTIVLLTDGLAECTPPPCDVAADLVARGLDIRINTVGYGFGNTPPDELACIAETTGGRYFDATDEESLASALGEATDAGASGSGGVTAAFLVAAAVGIALVIWALARPSAPWNQRRLVHHRVGVAATQGRGVAWSPSRDAEDGSSSRSIRLEVRPGHWTRIEEEDDHA